MDAQQFLAEFGHIANAPGGVARLRELVLQLAISGRLVERISTDSPVDDSLDQAAMQRAAYESELELRPTRVHSPLNTSPFAIPAHWRWVRLEQLALYIQRGKGPKYAERGAVSVVSQKCIQWAGFDISQARHIADESVDAYGKERFLCPGDLLWNSTGTGTAGRVAIFEGQPEKRAVADSHVTVMRLANTQPKYLWCVIASPWVQARIHPTHPESLVSGTTQQVELATSTVRALAVPYPPVEEQVRIVAKVDELMALCDRLEKQQQDRRKLQNALRQSTLQALASAESPHELQASWQRLQANFGRLFNESTDIKDLRLALKELAIQGLLTDQRPTDGDAGALFPGTAATAPRGPKRTRANLPSQPVLDTDTLFPLPKNWIWVRVGELGSFLGGGTPSKSNPSYWQGSIPWVSPKDMKVARISSAQDHISDAALSGSAAKLIPVGSVLVVVRGMILAHSFPVALTSKEVAINQDMKALSPYRPEMGEFLLLLLTGSKRRLLELVERSTHGTCRLETERFASCVVGIPPLAEQARIVDTVNKLMLVCDAWESQLNSIRKCSEQLAIATVARFTGISHQQRNEVPMKAPPTELIAPLRLGTLPAVKDQAPLATLLARHQGEMSARDLWQRFGGEIDAFYAQLKTEVAHGWITEPPVAEVRAKAAETAGT